LADGGITALVSVARGEAAPGGLRGHSALGHDQASAAHPRGPARLERTGPFVPPVTLAGISDLLVTGAFRAELERSPLTGLGIRPAEKARIVRLEWERWDLTGDEPQEYPQGGEPEGYVLDRPHDPELAAQIGPIWEVVLPGIQEQTDATLVRDQPATRHIYASQRAKNWLEQHASHWLSFTDWAGK
jgi:hypothetical protein